MLPSLESIRKSDAESRFFEFIWYIEEFNETKGGLEGSPLTYVAADSCRYSVWWTKKKPLYYYF